MPITRSTIDEIKIQNFKFFPKLEKPIVIDGKHCLLYGENGSGKSSIYWALYTLLECANKDDIGQIQKYFDPGDDERLTNIFLSKEKNNWEIPYVAITLKDKSRPYYVSFDDTTINANKEAQESNFSSDFITYRNLLSLYNFAHSENIDLFPFFTYAVLPYVKFTPVQYWHEKKDKSIVQLTTESANGIWNFVSKGPQKNVHDKQSQPRFPIGQEKELTDYRNIVAGFKSGLQELITYINTEGNPILKDELKYNLTFKLELDEEPVYNGKRKSKDSFLLTRQKFVAPEFRIWFRITEYEGVPDAVKRAHSFLNEARLTAVGLAIRLAVLKKSLSEDAKLKILVLDDLLISLDMSNREKVIDLILNKYVNEYQVFVLTHDRVMFEDTLKHIELFYKSKAKVAGITDEAAIKRYISNSWTMLEMYQAIDNTGIPKPFITDSLSNIKKALYYFREQVDYNACGNNLRAALEDFFIEFIPASFSVGQKLLGPLNAKARDYFDYVGFSTIVLDKIERYLTRSLNSTSHYNPKANYYRKELEDIFDIYFGLKQLKNKPLIDLNERMKFSISTSQGNNYTYTVALLDDVRIYNKNDGGGSFMLDKDRREYVLTDVTKNSSSPTALGHHTGKLTFQELYNDTVAGIQSRLQEDAIIETNMNVVFKNLDDIALDDLLKQQI